MYNLSDPRTIITPDAFSVSPALVGTPLAKPSRRLAAVLIDLVLIFAVSRSGWLLLGVGASLLFLRMATRRRTGDRLGKIFRVAVGCFGSIVLVLTTLAFWGIRALSDAVESGEPAVVSSSVEGGDVGLLDILGGIAEGRDLATAESAEGANDAALALVERMLAAGTGADDILSLVEGVTPEDAPWREEVLAGVRRMLDSAAVPEPAVEPDTLSLADALELYASTQRSGDSTAVETPRFLAAQSRILQAVGADSLDALQSEVADLRRSSQQAAEDLEATREALEEAQEGSAIFRFFRDVVDDLGLTFGWGGLYMTLFLAWWGGRTPGKRAMGIRVIQLDGQPLSWWMAFERAGGYAAGFATGLLGFAQVFWDPNRQAIHDRVARTVVVLDGAAPLPGPWRATEPANAETADKTGPTGTGGPARQQTGGAVPSAPAEEGRSTPTATTARPVREPAPAAEARPKVGQDTNDVTAPAKLPRKGQQPLADQAAPPTPTKPKEAAGPPPPAKKPAPADPPEGREPS